MKIERRSLPMYMFLNILTLGVYGFLVSKKMGEEINKICKGDGEEPYFGYTGAVLIRSISGLVGILIGFIAALSGIAMVNSQTYGMGADSNAKAVSIFIGMTFMGLMFTLIGNTISSIYMNYWWYKQANRLKFNAGRYDIDVKESGLDHFLLRTVFDTMLLPINIVIWGLALLIPGLIIWLISLAESTGAMVFISILMFLISLPLMAFGGELTAGSGFSMFFMFKNMNRYAKAVQKGAAPFDPMGYEYYPSVENDYLVRLQKAPTSSGDEQQTVLGDDVKGSADIIGGSFTLPVGGNLLGEKGSCAGYHFELSVGEEVIVGKDARMASVVIDPVYKEVSRKHFGVCFGMDGRYRITDYSSNGTWVNGEKLVQGQSVYVGADSEIKLANGKNVFRVG